MKIVRINMADKSVKVDDIPQQYAGMGGRGLTSFMINDEVPPQCHALGPDNKLILAIGTLTGTPLVNTGRLSIGAKSPLTHGIKESNVGGTMAAALAKQGIQAVVIEGQSTDGHHLLHIDGDGNISLEPADELRGMRTYALCEKLFAQFGEKNSILCIGPAGEYKLASASIQASDVDNRPCRAAGRGGLGAVMGSKGLKAVVVHRQGKAGVPIADPEAFKEAAKTIAQGIKDNIFTGHMLPPLGTAALVGAVNALGAFPSYNATQGTLEGFEKISGEELQRVIQERGGETTHLGCSQCAIRCSNVFVDAAGKYVTSSLEYETIWSMGGMTGITDLDAVAKLDYLCDDIGLDTMNTGVALSVAMDAGYKPFGDGQAAVDMMEEIAEGTAMGMILGAGPSAVGKHFGHHRVPVVKNQSIAAYDPRAMQGNGVTYATSPMGADHTCGNLVGAYLGGKLDPLSADGQVEASREAQIALAALDSTGMCLLAGGAMDTPEVGQAFTNAINARLGIQSGPEDSRALGIKILEAELEFNRKAGLTEKDDRLAAFFYEEPLPPHNKTFLITDEDLDQALKFKQ
jgi:aldehyde:ferredoxin oxidoreductase